MISAIFRRNRHPRDVSVREVGMRPGTTGFLTDDPNFYTEIEQTASGGWLLTMMVRRDNYLDIRTILDRVTKAVKSSS